MIVGRLAEEEKGQDGERRALTPTGRVVRGGCTQATGGKIGRRKPGVDDADRADEAVAFAHDGFEETWMGGIVTESGANFPDDVVDVGLGIEEEV